MDNLLERIWSNPVAMYVLSFAGLGVALMLGLGWLHKRLGFSDRVWALLTVACGSGGGVLAQGTGLIVSPVESSGGGFILAAFVGAIVACAAASFSPVDMRKAVMKTKDE